MPSGIYKRTNKTKESLKLSGTSSNYLKTCVDEKNHNWKENPKYQAIHIWLRTKFGHSDCCENRNNNILDFACNNKSKRFVWALFIGNKYIRDRSLYRKLCQYCNLKYDKLRRKI